MLAAPTAYTEGNDLNTGYTGAFWRAGQMAPGFEFDQVLPTFANKAVGFINRAVEQEKPFFLYVPFAAPHTPWVPTTSYQDTSMAGSYGDFVAMVDGAVDQILDALKVQGVENETIIVFTSDNGPFWTPALIEQYAHRSAGPLRGMKADAWEGGHRIPFIVKWPGVVPANMKTQATTTLANLMGTVADILGVTLPGDVAVDSYSILPVLKGQMSKVPGQNAVIHHSSRGFFAIRQGPWKLILGRGSGGFSVPQVMEPQPEQAQGQLYHLSNDPSETRNLYQAQPAVVEALSAELERIKSLEQRSF